MTYLAYFSIHALFDVESPENIRSGILNTQVDVNAYLYMQAMASLGGFALTAIMFARLNSVEPIKQLGLKNIPVFKLLALGIVSVLAAQFFIEFLVTVNKSIPLPSFLENGLRAPQDKMEGLVNRMLDFKNPLQLIPVVFVIAVVPALGEELLFRGLIMGTLLRAKVNVIASILISGFLFAIMHAEFDNTLAIWVLGSFLGYLYYVTGSLWVPIAAHFVNNFLTILLKYLFNIGVISADMAEAHTPWYATAISVVLFSACLYLFYKWKQPADFEDEDDDDGDTTESELIPVQ